MPRPQWFSFYPADYDADTSDLTIRQDGIYGRLIRRSWMTSDDGSIPAQPLAQARLIGCVRPDSDLRQVVSRYWPHDPENPERRFNPRLREEAVKAVKRVEAATNGGNTSADRRRHKATGVQPELNGSTNRRSTELPTATTQHNTEEPRPSSMDFVERVPRRELQEQGLKSSSPGAGTSTEGAVIEFATNRPEQIFAVTVAARDEFQKLYPAADVDQELRNMAGWLLANPANRKTLRGTPRFINAWLSRAQNGARPVRNGHANGKLNAAQLRAFAEHLRRGGSDGTGQSR